MSGLTQRQSDCLQAIIRLTSPEGVAPSYDELKLDLGLASKSGVNRLVTALVERGYVSRRAYRNRALSVLREPKPFRPRGYDRADIIMADIMSSDAGPFIGEQSQKLIRACIARGLAQ